ncbi:hypothetical protein C8F01DRAFT_1136350 [Mycena amicta]|nr:hypothetical protein C8F01DRAFT_1136350 [Mycena amicta]
MSATVHPPFLTLCDAAMGYHLPSCLRLLEGCTHSRDSPRRTLARPRARNQNRLSSKQNLRIYSGCWPPIISYAKSRPTVFATNRISSLLDSGKSVSALQAHPERKYDEDASAVAAFIGLCTDELHKSSTYLTEAVFPGAQRVYPELERSRSPATSNTTSASALPAYSDPTRAPFNHAFGCAGVGYFAWLEGEGCSSPSSSRMDPTKKTGHRRLRSVGGSATSTSSSGSASAANPNQFRLERFGKAMAGTGNWEAPGAVLAGFDWGSLAPGSTVVDVGGGIGSTTMVLASAYGGEVGVDGLRFVVQDRQVVVEMGKKAWRAKCPELLDAGAVRFQVHDFFTPQPILNAAVYFLRVVLHDWPDAFAQKILLRLREAAGQDTRLVIADWVLPMACVDEFGVGEGIEDSTQVEGAEEDARASTAPCQPRQSKRQRVLDGPHCTSRVGPLCPN